MSLAASIGVGVVGGVVVRVGSVVEARVVVIDVIGCGVGAVVGVISMMVRMKVAISVTIATNIATNAVSAGVVVCGMAVDMILVLLLQRGHEQSARCERLEARARGAPRRRRVLAVQS